MIRFLRSASCPGALVGGVVLAWLACAAPLEGQAARPGLATDSGGATSPRPEEARAAALLGSGKPREAIVELDRAVAAYRRGNDRPALARALLTRSTARRALGEWAEAARDAEAARTYAAGDAPLLVQALTHVARVATERTDFARAELALREAVSIADRLGDAKTQATVLRMFAVLDDRRGRVDEALDHNTRAVQAADRSGDAALRVRTRGGASATLIGLSRYDAALALAQESHEIAERAGTPALRASALFDLAQTHANIWNLDRAAELWTATIDAHRQMGNQLMGALALKQSVETWFALGEFDRAAADGEQAVTLLRDTGQVHYVAETMARVALSHVRRGRAAEARAWADRARAELPRTPESRHLFVHNDLGLVACELGDLVRARADFTRVLEVSRLVGNVEYDWRAHWGFGRAALRDDPPAAVAPLEHAIASVERLRQTIPEAGLRASFMINRVGPYDSLVEAHMATAGATAAGPADDRTRRALEVAECARSRALADLLAEARARTTDPRLAAIRDEETAFGRRFSAAQKRVADTGDAAGRAAALEALRDLERKYETFVVRLRRDTPAYAALTHPRALSAAELSGMLAPDEALIEFLLTDQQGFAWVGRRDGIHGYRVPGTRALDPQIRLLNALLNARDDDATARLGAQLYASLFAQAEPALRGARRLIIVPDGVLQRLPFALLRAHDRWLVETHTLALAPSATILHFLRQSQSVRAPEPLLALAVPETQPGQAAIFVGGDRPFGTLTHASTEVEDARRLLRAGPDSVRTGAAATERTLKSPEAGRYRVLHIAAHAIADEIVPRRSAVLLTPDAQEDGLLQVSEIANLSLNADLVVLAACRSHVGRLVRGEGLLSLSRAFMHAGARAVLATRWMVGDRDTAWLMREFYSGLRDGLAPDAALQQAQLRAIRDGGARAAPSLWGAFVVVGEARTPIVDAVPAASTYTPALFTGALLVLGGVAGATLWHRTRRRSR